jgi:type I restriction enzyme S subunit
MNPELLLTHFNHISDASDAVPRLRSFILELAVRGKLVEQDPQDEPALMLIKRIGRQRSQIGLVGGTTKLGTELPAHDSLPFEIPSNWIWVRLGAICSKTGSGSTPRGGKSVYQRNGVPFLRSQNVYDDGLRLDDVAYITHQTHEKMSGTSVEPGDLLLNITGGSIGRCCLVSSGLGQANVSQHVAIIRVALDGIQRYLHQLVRSPYFQSLVLSEQTGAGRGGLPKNRMDRIPIALPPLDEQHRIVAKVDELMALCDRLETVRTERDKRRDRLTAASHHHLNNGADAEAFREQAKFHIGHFPLFTTRPGQIKQLRQTILNLAVRGFLVPQDPNDEFAEQLLGDRLFFLDSEAEPWKLPSGWAWSSLTLIGETLGGGTPSKTDLEFWNGSIPWVSPKDMKVDTITDTQDHISAAAIEQSAARLIPTGSLLMVVRGMILAHSFPTASTAVPVTINQDMKAIVPFRPDLIRFLFLLTKGLKPEVLRLVLRSTHGTCKLLTDDLFSLPIPIPPLAEQRRIVAKVDELMALCDQLEAQLTSAQTDTSRLLDAVLHHALLIPHPENHEAQQFPILESQEWITS